MTQEIAYNIVTWMGGSYGISNGGYDDGYYHGLTPSYRSKSGPIDSIDELMLVQGVTWDLLYGSDLNRNGTQEDGETDSNSIVAFDRGLSAYLTVHSREQNSDPTGNPYVFLNNTDLSQLYGFLVEANVDPNLAKFIIMYRQNGGSTKAGSKAEHAQFRQRARRRSELHAQRLLTCKATSGPTIRRTTRAAKRLSRRFSSLCNTVCHHHDDGSGPHRAKSTSHDGVRQPAQ